MASLTTPNFQSRSIFYQQSLPNFTISLSSPNRLQSTFLPRISHLLLGAGTSRLAPPKRVVVVSATAAAEKPNKRYPGEAKGFVEEMRFVAMKLHTKEQAREGEKEVKEPEERPVMKWEPAVDGYLRFLVDSKLVYDTLETIVQEAPIPYRQ